MYEESSEWHGGIPPAILLTVAMPFSVIRTDDYQCHLGLSIRRAFVFDEYALFVCESVEFDDGTIDKTCYTNQTRIKKYT
jgi:hypothetical protein